MFEVEHRGGECTRQVAAVVEGREGNGELGNLLGATEMSDIN